MTFERLRLFGVALLFMAAAGCATIEKQAFNKSANKTIKAITVLEPTPSEGFGVLVLNHPGLSFGLIGATAYAIEMQSKSKSFDEAMKPLGWSLTQTLTQQLSAELSKAGYAVRRAKFDRERMALIKDYKILRENSSIKDELTTDAWLDVQTRDPLYVANSPTADYVPSIGLTVRLVTASDQSLLYREDFFYGFSFRTGKLEPIVIPSDAKYRFVNMDALKQDSGKTLAGVAEGVPLLVQRIVDDLVHDGLTRPVAPSVTATSPEKPTK